ncbi:uncharacterized protein LOC113749201 [Coffea eugenioides]|uniref:uncharacterized protein LOC113749201 n=1 Tax=Coffea eugenioides TaxID=49369 RepID=UPI000F608D41|nr:uncharacterized protein LOC113749201 [Coffea eugenioides]
MAIHFTITSSNSPLRYTSTMHFENYDPCFPDQPVVDLYLQIWGKLPAFKSKPAFIWAEDDSASSGTGASTCSAITYQQLNNSADCISSQLLLPLQRGDTVVVMCAPGLELVEIIFGCQRAGLLSVPVVPPDPSFAEDNYHHLVRVISQTKPKAAIANHCYIERVKQYKSSPSTNKQLSEWLQKLSWISIEAIKGKKLDGNSNSVPYSGCKAEEVYLIQYTSGATGIPKPVLVTAGAAAHNVRAARKAYDLHPNSVIVSWLPQYHDCGLMFLLLTVVSGATSVLTSPATFLKRPRIWLELITFFRATCTPVPSFTLPLVLKRGGVARGTIPINLESMKNLIVINEPIYKDAVEEFIQVFRRFGLNPSAISPSYGLAENCTFVSTAWRIGRNNNLPTHNKLLPSARLISFDKDEEEDIEILVVNEETQEPVEDGTEGEIWISSPSNASGYLGHPSLSREVFNGMLSKRVGRCYVRTGDRGVVIGDDRYLFVTGRISDIIKLPNGQELHPHYIETAAYNSHPKILRGGCIAAFMVSGTLAIVAEIQNFERERRAMRNICEGIRKSIMEEESVAVGLIVLAESGSVPKTTSGKIRRWLAKENLIRAKIRTIMQMELKEENCDLAVSKKINHSREEGKGETCKLKGKGEVVAEHKLGGIILSLSEAPTKGPLLSSL